MNRPRRELERQYALVTGASSGIGAAIAEALAKEGAAVAVHYSRNREGAESVLDEIAGAGGEGFVVQADVSREDDVRRMFREVLDRFETLDILVSNAGVQKDAPLLEMSLEDWSTVLGVNLTGQFLCAREAAREFLRRGKRDVSRAVGKIICMSSVHEAIPWAGRVNYAASKGGVMQLAKSMAQELAGEGVRVNAIAPGAIKTRINREAWETPEAERDLLKLIPYRRVGEVDDVARAAVWLASDDSDYVCGETLYIDGGMMLYPGFAEGG